MKCPVCGADVPDFAQFCSVCNTPTGYRSANSSLSEKEFYKLPSIKKYRGNIMSSAVILYICAGISLIVNVIITYNVFIFVDIILLICLGLGIQLGKSRVCAVIATVYGTINTVERTISTGRLAGWWVLVAGIFAIAATFPYQKAWKNYRENGILPN